MSEKIAFVVDGSGAKRGAKEVVDALRETGQAARDANGRFVSTKSSLERLTDSFNTAGRQIKAFAALIGISLATHRAAEGIGKYELAMKTLGGVIQATQDQMEAMDDMARRIARTMPFAAHESGNALLTLARAGLTAGQAMAVTRPVLDLASAEMMGIDEAADMTVGTLMQFGLRARDAAHVADVLVASSNAANTTVRDLGEALKYSGPFANALGISLEETAAASAVLSNNNIRGSMAGVQLKGVMAGLAAPTRGAKEALKELGLQAKDVDVAVIGLDKAMSMLRERGMNARQAEAIFGRVSVPGALVLASSMERVREIDKINRDADGTAERLATTINTSLIPKLKILGGLLMDLLLRSTGLLTVMHAVVDTVSDMVRYWSGLTEGFSKMRNVAIGLAKALEMAGLALAYFYGWSRLIQITELTLSFSRLWSVVVTGTMAARAGMLSFFRSIWLALMSNPWTAIITGIASALFLLRNRVVTLGDETATVGEWISAVLGTLMDRFGLLWDQLRTEMSLMSRDLGTFLGRLWSEAASLFERGADVIKLVLRMLGNYAISIAIGSWNAIKVLLTKATQAASELWNFANADSMSERVAIAARIAVMAATDPLKDASKAFRDAFQKDYVGPVVNAVDAGMRSAVSRLQASVKAMSSVIMSGLRGSWLGREITSFWDEVKAKVAANRSKLPGSPEEPPLPPVVPTTEYTPETEWSKQRQRFEDLFTDLELERKLLYETNREREIAIRYREAEKLAAELQLEDADRRLAQYRRQLELLEDTKKLRTIAEGTGNAFGQMFKTMITGAKSAREAMFELSQAILDTVLQAAVVEPIAGLLTKGMMGLAGNIILGGAGATSGLGGSMMDLAGPSTPTYAAHGEVFAGPIRRFAYGDVFRSPTTIGYTGGVGQIAESGPEVVAPLARDSKGRMGIRQVEGGGGTRNYYFNIHTKNADEFRRMPRSVYKRLTEAVA